MTIDKIKYIKIPYSLGEEKVKTLKQLLTLRGLQGIKYEEV